MTKFGNQPIIVYKFLFDNCFRNSSTNVNISRRSFGLLPNIPKFFCVKPFVPWSTTRNMASTIISGSNNTINPSTNSKEESVKENGTSASNLVDTGKRAAAYACVDKFVKSGYSIGAGTGSTAKHAIFRLAEKYNSGQLRDIVCVPTSFQARQLILENGLPLGDLERYPELDVCIDGADEVDEDLNCIKGGGGCLTQEKIVMSCAKYFYVIADSRKMSSRLGERWESIPLEVVPMAYAPIKRRIEHAEGGEAHLRMGMRKAGPVVTDNGNFILDWNFPKSVSRTSGELTELHTRLKLIPGVVETGLFVSYAQSAFFGMPDGSVVEKKIDADRRISPAINKRPPSMDGPAANGVAKK